MKLGSAAAASGQRATSRWLIATGAVLVVTLGSVNWTLSGHSKMLRETVQNNVDNAGFNLFQFESHLLRLQESLMTARVSGFRDPAEMADLSLRYEVFVSRLEILDTPRMHELLGHSPEFDLAVTHSTALVRLADPWLVEKADRPLTPEQAVALLNRTHSLAKMLHDLTLLGVQVTAEQAGLRNAAVERQNQLVLVLSVFQSLVTLAFAVLAMRQFRQQQARRNELEATALKLDAARLQAEAASRAKSDFLATMSHELRTPFNGMLGMLDLLADSPLTTEQRLQLHTAAESAEHLLRILNDVLDASKLEAGQLSVQPQPQELHVLILGSVELITSAARAKNLHLVVDLHDDLPRQVLIDGQRLRQILLNLLTNAIKFSESGNVELTASLSALGSEELVVNVRDHGIGMDEATMKRLFQRFSQGDASTSRRFGGTGLGLEISRSLARLMGGDITVSSTAGRGSCFTLRVAFAPVPSAALSSAAPDAAPSAPHLGFTAANAASTALAVRSLDVLVAEDQPVNRLVIQLILERMGHRPRFAEDGAQTVQCVRERRPDLVLMDLHMPGMNGFEATRQLRADASLAPGLRIVALSADALAASQAEARLCGMDDFLTKPVRRADLERVLQQVTLSLVERELRAQAGDAYETPDVGNNTPDAACNTPTAAAEAATVASLAWDGALSAWLDRARIEELCDTFGADRYLAIAAKFLSDQSGTAARLMAALQSRDVAETIACAHALKGAAANLGYSAVAEWARVIECQARQAQDEGRPQSQSQTQALNRAQAHALARTSSDAAGATLRNLTAVQQVEQVEQLQQLWLSSREACQRLGQLTAVA